jgi:hypothetical protein
MYRDFLEGLPRRHFPHVEHWLEYSNAVDDVRAPRSCGWD